MYAQQQDEHHAQPELRHCREYEHYDAHHIVEEGILPESHGYAQDDTQYGYEQAGARTENERVPDADAALRARVVQQDEDGHFRVVSRGKADEGDDIFLLAGYLLRRFGGGAGLAAYAVTRDIGIVARALGLVADDLFEDAAHRGAGLLAH